MDDVPSMMKDVKNLMLLAKVYMVYGLHGKNVLETLKKVNMLDFVQVSRPAGGGSKSVSNIYTYKHKRTFLEPHSAHPCYKSCIPKHIQSANLFARLIDNPPNPHC